MKLHTTKNLLKQHHACTDSYKKLVNHLGSDWPDDKPINLLVAFDIHDDISEAVKDCLWCFRATIEDYEKEKRIIAAKFAERIKAHNAAAYAAAADADAAYAAAYASREAEREEQAKIIKESLAL
jgi:hypothetical protein